MIKHFGKHDLREKVNYDLFKAAVTAGKQELKRRVGQAEPVVRKCTPVLSLPSPYYTVQDSLPREVVIEDV